MKNTSAILCILIFTINTVFASQKQCNIKNHLVNLEKATQNHSGDVFVYIKINENKLLFNVVLIDIQSMFSENSLSVSYFKNLDPGLTYPFETAQGQSAEIDGLLDKRLNNFKSNYIPFSQIVASLDHVFYKQNNMDQRWNITEIGYVTVHDEKNPWRWAITFTKKVDHKTEQKSFIFENGLWVFQKEPIADYYFAPFLDNFKN